MKYQEANGLGGAPTAPSATEATLLLLLARATASNNNEAIGNANTAAIVSALQTIINERKPYQLVQCVDLRSYAIVSLKVVEDGTINLNVSDVVEDGSSTGAQEVNWGIDNISGAGNNITINPDNNGTHEVVILGGNGRTFKRRFNHQNRKGINHSISEIVLVADIYDRVDSQEYLSLTVADASGAVRIGDFDLQNNTYTPVRPDIGKNRALLNTPPVDNRYLQPRQFDLQPSNIYTIPPNRINSINVWIGTTAKYEVLIDGVSKSYNESFTFAGFTASGGYLNKEITVKNIGSDPIVIATLS